MSKDKQKRISSGVKFKNNKLTIRWPYLASIFAFFALLPTKVFAVSWLVSTIATLAKDFWMWPLIVALKIETTLLTIVASYNNFTSEGGVIIGWIALRDLSNMFFILILLIIAFATILRIQSYGYQQLLRRTLIIAILINFSKTIVGFVIDFVQIIMLTFISAVNDIMSGGLIVGFGMQKIATLAGDNMDFLDFLVGLILGAVFTSILVVVVGVMIMMLMMRIVALWVAIVLAPLAFLASIFPATKSFYDRWVKELGSNLVTGPMLAFFLWLTFSIVGNGDAYTTFTDSNVGGGPTVFLATFNMVNYIIAISLLLMGIKMAASSGAAGANIASKGMQKIQDTAGHIARRYPMALGQRIGSAVSDRITDKDGNSRLKFKTLGKIPVLNKVLGKEGDILKTPFWGGRFQRGSEKMKGRNAARIMQEKVEDEKNLLPQSKVDFQKTYGEGAADKTGWSKIYSRIGSWGGDKEREAMMYQNMQARGEINSDNAQAATNALRNIGDEEGMQHIQSEYWTFKDEKEAALLLEKRGLSSVFTNVKTAGFTQNAIDPKTGKEIEETYIDPKTGKIAVDEEGNELKRKKKVPRQGVLDTFNAVGKHDTADYNAIASLILKWSKQERGNIMTILKDHFDFKGHFKKEAALDVKNGSEQDKRNIIPANTNNPGVIWSQALAKIYNQMMGDSYDDNGNITKFGADRWNYAAGMRDIKNSRITPGQVATRLQQWHGETDKQFEKRKEHAEAFDKVNLNDPETLHEAFAQFKIKGKKDDKDAIDAKEFEKYRQIMYRQLWGIDAYTENLYGEKRNDFHNNDHIYEGKDLNNEKDLDYVAEQITRKWISPEDIDRGDIFIQKNNPSKEGETEHEVRRKKAAEFDSTEAFEKYEKELERKKILVKNILATKMEDIDPDFDNSFGKNMFNKTKQRMVAEILGDKRTAHSLVSKSIWGEATDGMQGDRAPEANTGNIHEAVMLDHVLDSFENQQQAQAFRVSTPEQTQYMVNKLAELGKQPQKILLENIPKDLSAAAMQKFNDVKSLQFGVLPQDLNLLGADLRKLSIVLKTLANQQGLTVKALLARNKGDNALNKYVANLKDVHESNDNIYKNKLVLDTEAPGKNSETLKDMIKETGYSVQEGGYLVDGKIIKVKDEDKKGDTKDDETDEEKEEKSKKEKKKRGDDLFK